MKENNDFFKGFDDTSNGSFSFGKSFLIPFFSGILGTTLVISIAFSVPGIKDSILNVSTGKTEETSTIPASTSNTGTVQTVSLSNYSDTAIYSANKVLPSIVGITVEYTVTSNFMQGMSQLAQAQGSGIIISKDGYILTNNHIINSSDSSSYYEVSKATKVYVYLYNDSTPYEAKIIGKDEQTDLAVIKVEKDNLTAAELGDSSSVKIGEFAMAIGNPLGMQSSVTSGIISAVNRTVTGDDGTTYTLIQTDAAINSGNSGGALVNSEGKVIGINTLKLSGTGIEGMGFAIPINDTIDIYKQLIDHGKVLRPYIGIEGIDITDAMAEKYKLPVGIYIKGIQSSSPASLVDLKSGDVIVSVDGTSIRTMDELNKIKESKNIGDTLELEINRNGQTFKVNIKLAEKP